MATPDTSPAPAAIILAAGKGTRMGGDLPKVLYAAHGRPMVRWVVDACRDAGVERIVVVVGYGAERVEAELADTPCEFVVQREQLGTGHAAQQAQPLFEGDPDRDVLVLTGDAPLIRASTLEQLLRAHRDAGAAATMATAELDDPSGYGRVVRDDAGGFVGIIEQKDATAEQRAIREVNPSYYCFRAGALFDGLAKVDRNNAQGEYYLTDVPGLLKRRGETVALLAAVPAEDVLGVNTPEQLAEVSALLAARAGSGSGPSGGASADERGAAPR